MINVVGIGPGSKGYIIEEVYNIVLESDILIGGKRQIDFIQDVFINKFNIDLKSLKEVYELDSNFNKLKDYINSNVSKKISVLASGEPLMYGIGDYIERNFSGVTKVTIISGISSIQYMFSKIKISMNDLYITSCHGRIPNFDRIFLMEKVAMVTDNKIGPREIAEEIISRGLDYKIYVGENLSYENEVITFGTPYDILNKESYDMCVVVIVANARR